MRVVPEYFFIAFCIGILYTYLIHPKPSVIIKYPTPNNAGKILYKDDAGVCYRYKKKEVKCPANKSKIEIIKPQQQVADDKKVGSILELMDLKF